MSRYDFDLSAGTDEFYLDPTYYDYEFKSRKADVNWYVDHYLNSKVGVLELGVGSGRIALPAVRKGAHVDGVDLSETMLQQARLHREKLPVPKQDALQLHQADMRDFALDKRFDLVTIPFNAFMHLYTQSDVDRCLTCVRQHLMVGGRLIVDVLIPDLEYLVRSPFKRYEGITFKHPTFKETYRYSEQSAYNSLTQVNQMWFHYERVEKFGQGPESFCLQLSHRCFFPEEMRRVLNQHGFEILVETGDFLDGEVRVDSESIAFECRFNG